MNHIKFKTMAEKLNDNSQDVLDVKKYLHDRIRKKRVLPELKGNEKHKFLNEWNTMKQVLDLDFIKEKGIADTYPKFTDAVLMDLCLNFAVWGAYNLHFKNTEPQDIVTATKIEKGKTYIALRTIDFNHFGTVFKAKHEYFSDDDGFLIDDNGVKHKIHDGLLHCFHPCHPDEITTDVPNWVLKDLRNTLRMIHNMIINQKWEGCLPRLVHKHEIQLEKILKNEEVTGREYLEALDKIKEEFGDKKEPDTDNKICE